MSSTSPTTSPPPLAVALTHRYWSNLQPIPYMTNQDDLHHTTAATAATAPPPPRKSGGFFNAVWHATIRTNSPDTKHHHITQTPSPSPPLQPSPPDDPTYTTLLTLVIAQAKQRRPSQPNDDTFMYVLNAARPYLTSAHVENSPLTCLRALITDATLYSSISGATQSTVVDFVLSITNPSERYALLIPLCRHNLERIVDKTDGMTIGYLMSQLHDPPLVITSPALVSAMLEKLKAVHMPPDVLIGALRVLLHAAAKLWEEESLKVVTDMIFKLQESHPAAVIPIALACMKSCGNQSHTKLYLKLRAAILMNPDIAVRTNLAKTDAKLKKLCADGKGVFFENSDKNKNFWSSWHKQSLDLFRDGAKPPNFTTKHLEMAMDLAIVDPKWVLEKIAAPLVKHKNPTMGLKLVASILVDASSLCDDSIVLEAKTIAHQILQNAVKNVFSCGDDDDNSHIQDDAVIIAALGLVTDVSVMSKACALLASPDVHDIAATLLIREAATHAGGGIVNVFNSLMNVLSQCPVDRAEGVITVMAKLVDNRPDVTKQLHAEELMACAGATLFHVQAASLDMASMVAMGTTVLNVIAGPHWSKNAEVETSARQLARGRLRKYWPGGSWSNNALVPDVGSNFPRHVAEFKALVSSLVRSSSLPELSTPPPELASFIHAVVMQADDYPSWAWEVIKHGFTSLPDSQTKSCATYVEEIRRENFNITIIACSPRWMEIVDALSDDAGPTLCVDFVHEWRRNNTLPIIVNEALACTMLHIIGRAVACNLLTSRDVTDHVLPLITNDLLTSSIISPADIAFALVDVVHKLGTRQVMDEGKHELRVRSVELLNDMLATQSQWPEQLMNAAAKAIASVLSHSNPVEQQETLVASSCMICMQEFGALGLVHYRALALLIINESMSPTSYALLMVTFLVQRHEPFGALANLTKRLGLPGIVSSMCEELKERADIGIVMECAQRLANEFIIMDEEQITQTVEMIISAAKQIIGGGNMSQVTMRTFMVVLQPFASLAVLDAQVMEDLWAISRSCSEKTLILDLWNAYITNCNIAELQQICEFVFDAPGGGLTLQLPIFRTLVGHLPLDCALKLAVERIEACPTDAVHYCIAALRYANKPSQKPLEQLQARLLIFFALHVHAQSDHRVVSFRAFAWRFCPDKVNDDKENCEDLVLAQLSPGVITQCVEYALMDAKDAIEVQQAVNVIQFATKVLQTDITPVNMDVFLGIVRRAMRDARTSTDMITALLAFIRAMKKNALENLDCRMLGIVLGALLLFPDNHHIRHEACDVFIDLTTEFGSHAHELAEHVGSMLHEISAPMIVLWESFTPMQICTLMSRLPMIFASNQGAAMAAVSNNVIHTDRNIDVNVVIEIIKFWNMPSSHAARLSAVNVLGECLRQGNSGQPPREVMLGACFIAATGHDSCREAAVKILNEQCRTGEDFLKTLVVPLEMQPAHSTSVESLYDGMERLFGQLDRKKPQSPPPPPPPPPQPAKAAPSSNIPTTKRRLDNTELITQMTRENKMFAESGDVHVASPPPVSLTSSPVVVSPSGMEQQGKFKTSHAVTSPVVVTPPRAVVNMSNNEKEQIRSDVQSPTPPSHHQVVVTGMPIIRMMGGSPMMQSPSEVHTPPPLQHVAMNRPMIAPGRRKRPADRQIGREIQAADGEDEML